MTTIGGWGSWGGSGESPNQDPNNLFGNNPAQPPPTGGGTGGAFPSGSGTPGNFGQQMYPWLQGYGGGYTAPMSPYEQGALGGYNQFVQGGMGLNNAGSYLNNELGGQYLNLNSNPYLQQIQQGEQGMKNYNDQQALSRIGSQMALGGTALSGAKMGAQSDYLRNSNNQFESMMGQLMNQNYGLERGLQSQAPGQLANLANTASGGYSQLFGMGALPRSLQQNDLNAQYQDFLRQSGGMQQAYNSPDQQILQMLYGGGYHGQYQPTYGTSPLDNIAGLLGGSNIDWGSILNSIGGLFGSGGTDTQGAATATDGQVIGYDSSTPAPGTTGPANYYDKNWYNNALTQAEAQQAQSAAAAKNGPNTTVPAILTLLLSMLGKSGSNKQKSGVGMGGPGSGGSPGSKSTSDPGYTTSGGKTYGNSNTYTSQDTNPDNQMGGSNDPFANPFNTPGTAAYQNPLFDPNNFAPGGPDTSLTDPFSPYYNDTQGGGLFDPNQYAGGGDLGGGDGGGGGGGYDPWS